MDMESLMSKLERRFPRLINCLGLLNTYDRTCNDCHFVYPCYKIQKDLQGPEFREGKYRFG